MTIFIIILVVVIVVLSVALFLQTKRAKAHQEDGEQLLKDYQRRVNEMEKLLSDYRALEQNFDSVGQGYEQALLAFDKMEEERQTMEKAKNGLEKQASDLLASKTKLEQTMLQKKDIIQKAAEDIKAKLDYNVPQATQIAQLANNILNINEVSLETAIECEDNCTAEDITAQAIRETGIDKIAYLKFENYVELEAQGIMLFTNQTMAARALVNLLDNAMKFTTSGSVTLTTSTDGNNVKFSVEDTGTGISPDDAEKIFEPFTKLNSFFDGAGCGLTVARSIARRLNGDIKFRPSRKGGACFDFTLPM